jgi:hypothetical protein
MPILCVCGLVMKSFYGRIAHEGYCGVYQETAMRESNPEREGNQPDEASVPELDPSMVDLERECSQYRRG